MKTQATRVMTLTVGTLALMVMGLALPAQAKPVAILNGSFEEATGWQNTVAGSPTFGAWYYMR